VPFRVFWWSDEDVKWLWMVWLFDVGWCKGLRRLRAGGGGTPRSLSYRSLFPSKVKGFRA